MRNKVFLAKLVKSHIARFMELSWDCELIDTMGWRPFEPGEEQRFLETIEIVTMPSRQERKPIDFAILATENKCPIGYVVLKGIDDKKAFAEIGIAIMDREYRSAGYGSKALRLAADYGFENLGLRILGLAVFPSNTRAIRVYEKVGFKKTDFLAIPWRMPDGEMRDMLTMQLTRKEWNIQGFRSQKKNIEKIADR